MKEVGLPVSDSEEWRYPGAARNSDSPFEVRDLWKMKSGQRVKKKKKKLSMNTFLRICQTKFHGNRNTVIKKYKSSFPEFTLEELISAISNIAMRRMFQEVQKIFGCLN